MKLLRHIFLLVLISLTSCEEEIDLDLNTADPKLVVEASINYYPDPNVTDFPKIKLSLTAPYFDTNILPVSTAEVTITDEQGNSYPFIHSENGLYFGDFEPQPNTDYTLEIIYENELYTATNQLVSAVPLEFVEQRNDAGFSGEDIELKVFFSDPAGEDNFYFFEGKSEKGNIYDALTDEFFDGNLIFGYYLVEDIEPNDVVTFNLYGINEQNYNYLFTLIQQGDAPAGPFETQPATVRGNITNQTNPDNFPLGYFRISEAFSFYYTVQ
ncbi:DUF4249 domain-containing protein [Planktosalinus lacus]|uniref:DUF4249 domain-containing protein n=1 Tax=Planktosalinus lacus TaxID=1526573 RepID=A0A8J2V962_9FLAO|nr:DUF4249 domain-containing protein [Planktosalinus lacus]GGD90789.1 hypothetical protein GCM10011312_13220 [Planktosalinus lacus]